MFIACTPKEKEINITKDFLDKNAKIGMTEKKVHKIFGSPSESFFEDTVDIDVYVKTKKGFTSKPIHQPGESSSVPREDIKNGNIEYVLLVLYRDGEVLQFMYSFKNEQGEIEDYYINDFD